MHLTSLHVIDYELERVVIKSAKYITSSGWVSTLKDRIRIKNDLDSLKNDYKQMKLSSLKSTVQQHTYNTQTAQIKFEVDSWADGGCYLVSCKLYYVDFVLLTKKHNV